MYSNTFTFTKYVKVLFASTCVNGHSVTCRHYEFSLYSSSYKQLSWASSSSSRILFSAWKPARLSVFSFFYFTTSLNLKVRMNSRHPACCQILLLSQFPWVYCLCWAYSLSILKLFVRFVWSCTTSICHSNTEGSKTSSLSTSVSDSMT